MAFGEAVKRLREARDWTQRELSDRADMPQATISRMERGVNDNPTQRTLEKLAEAFDISVSQLLVEAGIVLPPDVAALQGSAVPDASLVELARIWGDLTDEDRQTALSVTRSLWERSARYRAQRLERQQEPQARMAVG